MASLLKLDDKGVAVRRLQTLLNAAGARPALVVDGWFGPSTLRAVLDAQARAGLVVDGIAGPKTIETLERGGQRPAWLLREDQLKAAADELGVPLAAVKAVNEVESRGSGFLPEMRPVILFERHIMYRQLAAAGLDADAIAARQPSIVNRAPGGYLGGYAEHRRLGQAQAIHAACAIESASWGLFQIMGFHWKALGYESAAHFAAQMDTSEGRQLEAFVRFILADPALHKALKTRKWATFAQIYNGPAYRKNLYDVRLARAFERYAGAETAAA
ncbi:N-acetylmuramidase domain-containing protein [Thauera butanivorans]|uniref:N-acetylmuramidase domain-containing protein n=1 Tax=Thauera butanivorans TaxID=86174 RepID=UPI0008396E3E|nr:N-acetylmuramidase domain-containing protein [Thauera butanivorans]